MIVLGLKRDVRTKEDYGGGVRAEVGDGEGDGEVLAGRMLVYPQEGLKAAQEMRCDRYCECSAATGELCKVRSIATNFLMALSRVSGWHLLIIQQEVFEDIAKTAAMTTTEKGGRSEGTSCSVM